LKFKLDENVDVRLAAVMAGAGHDVDTVLDEGLKGADDNQIYKTCQSTGRVLVTLDLDFSSPIRYSPTDTEGIVVLRPCRDPACRLFANCSIHWFSNAAGDQ